MTRRHRRRGTTPNPDLLELPRAAGRAIVESGSIIACPVLGTGRFVDYCKARGLNVNAERLLRFERLGFFRPIFRVKTPPRDAPPFYVPIRRGNNWFRLGWAWDATRPRRNHPLPTRNGEESEAYYSVFQLDALKLAISEMTLSLQLDDFLLSEREIDWGARGKRWMESAAEMSEVRSGHNFRAAIPLLCQYISNAYYPRTQTDQRTIRVGLPSYSDDWLEVHAFKTDWHQMARAWNPKKAEQLFKLTPAQLRHAYTTLAGEQERCDPLEHWYQLVQFVSLDERACLKGDALRAETLRSGCLMLGMLHKDLYGEDLPHPNEVYGTIITHFPELEVRKDVRRYLEFVANRYGVNPQPKLCLILEGHTEKVAVEEIFERHFGMHPGRLGIEIVVLSGVDTATGGKEDRFRAILRLVDYLHHHQTLTFLILDNEGYAKRLKNEARKAKSTYHRERYVTRYEYIKIWRSSFEFDNFSDTQLAKAMTVITHGAHRFTPRDVAVCRTNRFPGSALKQLYEVRMQTPLGKLALTKALLAGMWGARGKRAEAGLRNKPIIKALSRVVRLAARNPFPVMQEYWELNQASKFLGKKRRS